VIGLREGLLGGSKERDTVNLTAKVDGDPVVPADGHIRLAAPEENNGIRGRASSPCRRVCAPTRSTSTSANGTAMFAAPPGVGTGGFVGDTLFTREQAPLGNSERVPSPVTDRPGMLPG